MTRRRSKRMYVIRINNFSDTAINELLDRIKINEAYVKVRPEKGMIIVKLVGFKGDIERSLASIKGLLRKHQVEDSCGISVNNLFKEVGSTFSPEILVETLRLQGYRATLSPDKNCIYSDAEKALVVLLAKKIIDASKDEIVRFRIKGRSTRKLLLIVSVTLGLSVNETLSLLEKEGIIKEDENGKIMLTMNLREALAVVKEKYSLRHRKQYEWK